MKSARWFGLLAAVGLIGCVTSSHVPPGARLVGGGLSIEYIAPEDGTAILIEKTSGRIVATKTLAPGDMFDFGPGDSESVEVLVSMFGDTNAVKDEFPAMPTNAFLQLYFQPAKSGRR